MAQICCCCCCVASVVSDSVQPHRWQPTRLPRPWDSPGKSSGVGCHCLHEPLIAKFRLKLKKVGKTTRPFRYDLNQIPYDYTMEVTNRFKELDLIDRVPEELWMEVRDIVEEAGINTISKKNKCKKTK